MVIGIVVGGVLGMQRRLIYFPDRSPVPPASSMIAGARDVTLRTSDGLELGAWFVPPQGEDTGLAVLLAHGNGGNRTSRAGLAHEVSRRGFAVLLFDYRGYGANPGSPSEEGLARDAAAALAALRQLGYPPERTVLLGESLGTAVAARLAARHPVRGLVLRSPFPQLADVGAHHYPWLPIHRILSERFPVTPYLRLTRAPVAVIRGDSDVVVPTELSHRVASQAPTLVEEVVLPGDHNDPIMYGPRVADVVARLAASRD